MAVRAFNTRVLVDEFDFSTSAKGVTVTSAVDALEASTLQSEAKQAIPGGSDGTIELSGYYTGPNAGDLEQELYDRLGSEDGCVVSVLLDTTAVGNPAYVQQTTWGNQLKLDGPLADLITLDGKWQDIMDRGLSVAHATVSGTGGQTVIDFGAGGATGGWAVLHVRAIDGTAAGATFTVQSAAAVGFSSPTTHGTFTLSDVGALTLVFSGAVGRYIRLNCTGLGGATSIQVTAIVGVAGVTYQLA